MTTVSGPFVYGPLCLHPLRSGWFPEAYVKPLEEVPVSPINPLNPVTSMNPMSPMNELPSRYLAGVVVPLAKGISVSGCPQWAQPPLYPGRGGPPPRRKSLHPSLCLLLGLTSSMCGLLFPGYNGEGCGRPAAWVGVQQGPNV